MKILKEISDWSVEYRQPNHTYLVNSKNQIVAYAKWHSQKDVLIFQSRNQLDKRYRKFIEVSHRALEKIAKTIKDELPEKEQVIKPTEDIRVFNVKSKGKVYAVTFNKNSKQVVCGCIGFNYRRYCKHSDAVAKKLGV